MKKKAEDLLREAGYTSAQIKLIQIRAEQRAQKGDKQDGRSDS